MSAHHHIQFIDDGSILPRALSFKEALKARRAFGTRIPSTIIICTRQPVSVFRNEIHMDVCDPPSEDAVLAL